MIISNFIASHKNNPCIYKHATHVWNFLQNIPQEFDYGLKDKDFTIWEVQA